MNLSKIFGAIAAAGAVVCVGYAGKVALTKDPASNLSLRGPASVAHGSGEIMTLAKGVQHYCVENFQLESCLAYASECGQECHGLLPQPLRQKMFDEYNRYLVGKGQKPLVSKQAQNSVIGQPVKR